MLVEDVMQTDVVTCQDDVSVQTAVVKMLREGVGSVIVTQDGEPVGIVTETDALYAGAATEQPFVEIAVADVLSRPLVTVARDATVRKAVNRMAEHDIKKLVVMDGIELEGIVTRTDVAENYGAFIREVHDLHRQRERWEARKADIDEF
jgi:CBS domain-containing protein